MNNILSFFFRICSALTAAFFLGLLWTSIYYRTDSIITAELPIMILCMLLSSLSFYYIGVKNEINIQIKSIYVMAAFLNVVYLALWNPGHGSIYELNIVALVLLALNRKLRIQGSE